MKYETRDRKREREKNERQRMKLMKLIVKKFYARFYAATIATFCCTSIESLHYTQMKNRFNLILSLFFTFLVKLMTSAK